MRQREIIQVPMDAWHGAHRLATDLEGITLRASTGDLEPREALTIIARKITKLVAQLSDLGFPVQGGDAK